MQNSKRPNLVPKPQPKTSLSTDGESSIQVNKKEQDPVVETPAIQSAVVEDVNSVLPVQEQSSIEDLDEDEDFDSQTPNTIRGDTADMTHVDNAGFMGGQDSQQDVIENVTSQALADTNAAVEQSINSEMQPPVINDAVDSDEPPLSELVKQNLEQSVQETLTSISPLPIDADNEWAGNTTKWVDTVSDKLNSSLARLVLSISTLGLAVRKTLLSASLDQTTGVATNVNMLALVVRLPKSPIHPYLNTLNNYQVALDRVCQNVDAKISARAFIVNKPLNKSVDLDEIANSIKTGGITPFNSNVVDVAVAAQDLVILVSNRNFISDKLDLVGELNSDTFAYSPESLDIISPALDAVAKYVRLVASKGYAITLPSYALAYTNFASELEIETDYYEPFTLNQYQEQFVLQINLGPHQTKEDLFNFVTPEFLGQRLLEKANIVDGEETSRFLSASALVSPSPILSTVSESQSFTGSESYELTLNFIHDAKVFEVDDTQDTDEEEEEE